jgi:hypothetical protein
MKTKRATPEQVELILHLYELRRESVMREARSFVGGAFLPKSDDELVSVIAKGGKETGFVLQVYGYWDMVCAFVLHGALSEPLVYDTCQEMYFQFAKNPSAPEGVPSKNESSRMDAKPRKSNDRLATRTQTPGGYARQSGSTGSIKRGTKIIAVAFGPGGQSLPCYRQLRTSHRASWRTGHRGPGGLPLLPTSTLPDGDQPERPTIFP